MIGLIDVNTSDHIVKDCNLLKGALKSLFFYFLFLYREQATAFIHKGIKRAARIEGTSILQFLHKGPLI